MSLPIGSIIIWNKTAAEIPQGWQVCNGTNGTPDLRDYFVRGATIDGDVGNGETGSHAHSRPAATSSDGSHTHGMSISLGGAVGTESNVGEYQFGVSVAQAGHGHSGGSGTTGSGGGHSHAITGNTGTEVTDPEHVKLYYIMRVA